MTATAIRIGRLEDYDLGVAVTFQPHGETVQIGQHFLALDVDGAKVECDGQDAVSLVHAERGEAFIFHGVFLSGETGFEGKGAASTRERLGTCALYVRGERLLDQLIKRGNNALVLGQIERIRVRLRERLSVIVIITAGGICELIA